MQFGDLADDPRLDHLDRATQAAAGAALIAHLGGQFSVAGQLPQDAGFMDRLGERLLTVNMLAQAHGRGGGDAVDVVGRGYGHRVDGFADLVEHLPEVLELLGLRILLPLLGERGSVDVAQANNGAATTCRIVGVAGTLAAHADATDLDAFVGAQHRAHVGESEGSGGGGGTAAQEAATIEAGERGRGQGIHGSLEGVNRWSPESQCAPGGSPETPRCPIPSSGGSKPRRALKPEIQIPSPAARGLLLPQPSCKSRTGPVERLWGRRTQFRSLLRLSS